MKKISIFILVIILLGGCSNKKKTNSQFAEIVLDTIPKSTKVIDNKRREIPIYSTITGVKNKLSEIAASVEFCVLANTPLINNELVSDIALTNEDIFILCGIDELYRFDKSGIFKNRIGTRGQGPEEYIQLNAPMMLDYSQKKIHVHDVAQRKVCSYQYDGTFIKNILVNNDISGLELTDSLTYIVRTNDSKRYNTNTPQLMFLNKDGKTNKKYNSYIYPIEKSQTKEWHFGAEVNPLWKFAGKYYTLEYGNDTIFRIEGLNLISDRILIGDQYKPTLKNLFHIKSGDKRIIAPILMRPNSAIFESANFILFRYYEESGRYFLIYDKSNGNIYISKHSNAPRHYRTEEILSAYFTDDLVSGLPFNPEYQSNGKLIGWLTATDIIEKRSEILKSIQSHQSAESEQLKKTITDLDEEDNSVLMIVTLK